MRNKRALIGAAILIFAAALAGGWFYFHSRVIQVWVYTDYAFRFKHADWSTVVDSRFQEVNRIYQRNGAGVRWKVLDSSEIDPTSDVPGIDSRRATMVLHFDRKTDVYVILTGAQEDNRTGSVSPFTRVAVVVDYPEKSETLNARLLAHELTHLFGAPRDPAWPAILMGEKPESDKFSPQTLAMIKRMRNYPFALGIDGLQGSWEKKALAALADNDPGGAGNPMAYAHSVLGHALLNERKTDAALAQFRLAVQADPKNTSERENLAEAYTVNGQEDLALEQGRELVRLAPDSPSSHLTLGALLGRTHQPEAAIQELQIAARLDPANADTKVLLGLEISGLYGHLDEGIATMQDALRLNPESARARDGLAKLQGLKEVVTEELAKQRGMLQDHPNDPDVHYRLAKVEARAGDLKGAIRDYQKTLDLRPDNGSPHADLAEMYLLIGDKDSAWAEVKKARALGTEPPASLIARLGPQK